jgi:hypothetical protein
LSEDGLLFRFPSLIPRAAWHASRASVIVVNG